MIRLKQLIVVCSIEIQIMPRCYNNSDGCIISKATASTAKSKRLSTWRNLLARVSRTRLILMVNSTRSNIMQTTAMLKAGTCWDGVTCRNRSIRKHMKLINRQSTVMAGTLHSGVLLVFSTIRSTNTGTPSMHTHALYG